MLTVYRERSDVPNGIPIIYDVQEAFHGGKYEINDYTRAAMYEIEGSTPLKGVYVKSGLTGTTIFVTQCSTGCLAALSVPYCKYPLSLRTVGLNARDFILTHCTSGNVVLDTPEMSLDTSYYEEDVPAINLIFNGELVTSLARLDALLRREV